MATAVLYEEDISLPADQGDRTGDLPEVDVVTSALSPTGPQHFALTLDDFDSPVTETTVTG